MSKQGELDDYLPKGQVDLSSHSDQGFSKPHLDTIVASRLATHEL